MNAMCSVRLMLTIIVSQVMVKLAAELVSFLGSGRRTKRSLTTSSTDSCCVPITLTGVMLLIIGSTPAFAQSLTAGREVTTHWLGEDKPLRVFLPASEQPDHAWPVIIYFHGTGGRASTGRLRHYTQDRGFIIVGKSYALPKDQSLSRQGVLREIDEITEIRHQLSQRVTLADRTYVSGFSKGGWMSDLLVSEGFPTLAGAMILGAGRMPDDVGKTIGREKRVLDHPNIAIYIGIGQMDTNLVYSLRAQAHYTELGHPVIFDEYLGKGHQWAADSYYLTQWLQGESGASLGESAQVWWDAAQAHAEKITDVFERYLFLERVYHSPFANKVSVTKRAELKKLLDRVRRHRSLKEAMAAHTAYQSALSKERAFKRSDELPQIALQFQRVELRYPNTHHGERAALDLVRLRDNYRTLTVGDDTAFPVPKKDVPSLRRDFAKLAEVLNFSGE